jgi:hypothetical protein
VPGEDYLLTMAQVERVIWLTINLILQEIP